MNFRHLLASSAILAIGLPAACALTMPQVFGDHMVLQSGQPVPVWGWATPGEVVTVGFGGQKKQATAAADGRWEVRLDPMTVSAQPAELTVAGSETVTFKDVLVGEVARPLVQDDAKSVLLDNQVVSLRLGKKDGRLIELHMAGDNRKLVGTGAIGYLDVGWRPFGAQEKDRIPFSGLAGTPSFRIVSNTSELGEISFYWPAAGEKQPFSFDLRYQIRPMVSGYYISCRYRKADGVPHFQFENIGWRQRVNGEIFNYRYLHDRLQGPLVSTALTKQVHEDKTTQLMNETFRLPDGDIWAKHQWCANDKLSAVEGVTGDHVGLWFIRPSYESLGGVRPHNTSDAIHETVDGPILLLNLENNYYGRGPVFADDGYAKYNGPFFVYLNSGKNRDVMWEDAKREAAAQQSQWPYPWVKDPLYPLERGSVTGQFSISDGSLAKGAWAILSDPDSDWQSHKAPYLFFTQADERGHFNLTKVRPGTYTLYAWVRGVYGELRHDGVRVEAGTATSLGILEWTPVKRGRLLWQIGTPDRDAHEFKGADTLQPLGKLRPNWNNFLFYHTLFPHDVNFTIGKSKDSDDWYYIHMAGLTDDPRMVEVQPPAPPVKLQKPIAWKINFELGAVPQKGALLTIATCSHRDTDLRVLVNGKEATSLPFQSSGASIGIRAGIVDKHDVREVVLPAALLKYGANTITLVHAKPYWLSYVLYDFLRLEAVE